MKTTNKNALYLFGMGLILSIAVLSLPSCGLETFDIVPDPSEYDSLTVSTTNGKFDKFTLDSIYLADIVIGVTEGKDTIRFVKGVNNLTYYFITPPALPVGKHQVRINAIKTLLTLKIDTITTLGSRTADAIVSDYLRDEVSPNVSYFSPGTPSVAAQLIKIRDTTQYLFNNLSADHKKKVAVTLLANKNLFKDFNTALRNLRSVPVYTVGPSAVCPGSDYKTYYPCLFESLSAAYSGLENHGRLLLAFTRALNGSFFYINAAGEYRLNLLSNPDLISGLLQFANLLPKGMIVGDLANKANNLTWIVDADFSQIANPLVFTHNITDTIPVQLSYRNIRSSDDGSPLVGNYITQFNAFRTWWNTSTLSFLPAAPALSPQTTALPLNDLSVDATLTIGSSNVTRAATNPSVLEAGFRVRFRIDALTPQSTTLNLAISHQGFAIQKTLNATIQPQL